MPVPTLFSCTFSRYASYVNSMLFVQTLAYTQARSQNFLKGDGGFSIVNWINFVKKKKKSFFSALSLIFSDIERRGEGDEPTLLATPLLIL